MAKTVASLAVSLVAKIGDFEKGFKKAQRIASRFSSDLAAHVGTIAKYGAAISGVAVGATAALVKNQLDAVDSTSKLARTLGISTENLVGYQRAAELAGVDSDALAKAAFRLNKSTDAAFRGMSADERLLAVADRYKSLGNEVSRSQYLTKQFGKAGMELGPLFEEGAAGIIKARKETEALRTSFSAIEGAQVEAAMDAFSTLQESISGAARRIAVQLAPYIQVASERLTDMAAQGDIGGQVVSNALNYISRALQQVANGIQLVITGWQLFVTGVKGLGAIVIGTLSKIVEGWNEIFKLAGIDVLENASKMLQSMTSDFADSTASSAQELRDAAASFGKGLPGDKVRTFFDGIQTGARKAAASASKLGGAMANDITDSASTTKTAQFRQIDLSRVVVGGVNPLKDKTVSKDQGDTMISTLKQIATNTGRGMALIT